MKKKRLGKAAGKRVPSRRARATKPPQRAPRPAARPAQPGERVARPAAPAVGAVAFPRLTVAMVEAPAPYAEVTIREPVTELSLERLFDHARGELLRYQPRRVLVDMHDAEVKLSISDLNNLVKLVAGSFVGLVERLAMVLRPQDLPPEKFFEPSMSHRGLPTYVSVDRNDAIDWLMAMPWPR